MPATGTAQAGQPVAKDTLEAEWERIVATLLAQRG
ncbi:hypothetical protein ACVIM9_002422 [Bradyrhizobium sp. USDA 4520]